MVEYKKQLKELKKSIEKCLCPTEKPLNFKHSRIVLMKTHELQCGEPIWILAGTYNLNRDRYTTWKFCHLMHKVLHDGHKNSLRDSIKYHGKLQEIAQYWAAQNDHMGQCVAWYCKVLQKKILFHQSYSFLSGNFELIAYPQGPVGWDENICFQICLDIFDYLGDLLHLQRVIFTNMDKHQLSPNSEKGMCRLAPLVIIIAECNVLYQLSITVLRFLYSRLTTDDIFGLCNRFKAIFEELKIFYEHVRHMQLTLDCLEIPQLPVMPPNFNAVDENFQEPSAPLITDLY